MFVFDGLLVYQLNHFLGRGALHHFLYSSNYKTKLQKNTKITKITKINNLQKIPKLQFYKITKITRLEELAG